MKKIIALILCLSMLTTCFAVAISAPNEDKSKPSDYEVEFTGFELSPEKQAMLLNHYGIVENELRITPFVNLLCIFGHSIEIGGGILTEHNYYTTSPRCRTTVVGYKLCSRNGCNYFEITSETVMRGGCH